MRTQIESICMLYVVDNTNLNQNTFNANVGYHVILQYGPPGGYLQRLSSEIRWSRFHSMDIVNAYFPIATFCTQIGSISIRTQEKAQSYEIVANVTINQSIRFDTVNTRTEISISQK